MSPRPFLLGFVLLMLFLSLSGDSPSLSSRSTIKAPLEQQQQQQQQQGITAATTATAISENEDGLRKGIKEKIIYDLSVANERLELEVKKLRQYVLDVRRAAREAGCDLKDGDILTLYPELHDVSSSASSSSGDNGTDSTSENTKGSSDNDSNDTIPTVAGSTINVQQKEVDERSTTTNTSVTGSSSTRIRQQDREASTVRPKGALP